MAAQVIATRSHGDAPASRQNLFSDRRLGFPFLNLYLCVSGEEINDIARGVVFSRRGAIPVYITYDDAIQQAALGVMRAVELYDPTHTRPDGSVVTLREFCVYWGSRYVRDHIRRWRPHYSAAVSLTQENDLEGDAEYEMQLAAPQTADTDPLLALTQGIKNEALREALALLTPKQQLAIRLYYFEQRGESESAALCKLALPQFWNLLQRAEAALKIELGVLGAAA
jgi:RNA polymerase sigma factor (sigma-70 family)